MRLHGTSAALCSPRGDVKPIYSGFRIAVDAQSSRFYGSCICSSCGEVARAGNSPMQCNTSVPEIAWIVFEQHECFNKEDEVLPQSESITTALDNATMRHTIGVSNLHIIDTQSH
jgi:hypothetical protein